MYNRYINTGGFENFFKPVPESEAAPPVLEPVPAEELPPELNQQAAPRSNNFLKNLFGDRIKMPDLNSDTLLLLAVAYFLVTDAGSEEKRNETLLIMGALLLLGF